MNGKDKLIHDTSGRFKTDKNFKNTILKNCSRLRQRSTDDHYTVRNNTIQPRISNYKRINNYRKIGSLKDNFIESKNLNEDISKDNISIDMNGNLQERKSRKLFRSNIRKAFFMDFNYGNKDKKENIENLENKENKNNNNENKDNKENIDNKENKESKDNNKDNKENKENKKNKENKENNYNKENKIKKENKDKEKNIEDKKENKEKEENIDNKENKVKDDPFKEENRYKIREIKSNGNFRKFNNYEHFRRKNSEYYKRSSNNENDKKNNNKENDKKIDNNNNENDRHVNRYEKKRNELLVQNSHNLKNETNDGIKELVINMKDNNGNGSKRSNSIRRIMNSLYYHTYTTEKKGDTINNNNSNYNINTNLNINNDEKKIENETYNFPNSLYNKNQKTIFSKINNEIDKMQTLPLNNNSNSSYIYKKKNKKVGNVVNNNNVIFNTYSTEDNSFIINDTNKDLAKKNYDYQSQNLIKVKLVYQKPFKRTRLTKENNNSSLNNTISVIQTVQRASKRRILFEKRKTEDIENIKENSTEKRKINNFLTPIIRFKDEKKLIISSKDSFYKIRNRNNFDNSNIYNNIKNSDNISRESYNEYNNDNFIENNNNENLIIQFFDDIIELCNGIEERTIFEILIKNINKKYIIDYNKNIPVKNKNDIENFEYCFKYFCIILITFFFLSKDEVLYKNNSIKIHLLFIQYIYSSLCYIGYQDLNSKNIKRFFKDYQFKKKVSIIQCTTSMIKLLFDEKEEYISLNNVLKQLMVNARTTKVEDITKIINQTILFCFNTLIKGQNMFPFYKQKNKGFNNIYNNYISNNKEEYKNDEKNPNVPYIKTRMRKKFCLVLDLDETISHSLKLNFGYYFLLRPGVIDFLTELSELYEIVIFTSSPQIYADNILDKIDEKGNLISHRLYKPHVVFERGKSVKKLNLIGRDLNKIIFVDNMKSNAKYNPKNLYLIPTWTDDIYDDELFKLKNKLKYIYTSGKFNDDITKAL